MCQSPGSLSGGPGCVWSSIKEKCSEAKSLNARASIARVHSVMRVPFTAGGTPAANARANGASWARVLGFLVEARGSVKLAGVGYLFTKNVVILIRQLSRMRQ